MLRIFCSIDAYIMEHIDREWKLRTSLPLPLLLQAKTTVLKYSFGAIYHGQTCTGKRCGIGVFAWPSGETYVGEFFNNRRSGQGYFRCSL